jgi:hypothetical protein
MSTHSLRNDRLATIEVFPPLIRDAEDHANHVAACTQELERLGVRIVILEALTTAEDRYRYFPSLRPWYKRGWCAR